MAQPTISVQWPKGQLNRNGWLTLARAANAGINIPTGCLGSNCGACEIEVNGKVVRACISTVPPSKSARLHVDFATDPYW